MPTEIIKRIAEVLKMSEDQVLAVLYMYYTETMQACLLDPQNQTRCIYGMLYLDDNNKLQVDSITPVKDTKLLGESDLFQMIKIIGQGPGNNVFSGK